jgi:glutathione synthase/RimK-type ligase-like ATP-grasp enzyme
MERSLFVLDARSVWHGPLIAEARKRGWKARRIFSASEVDAPGYGFIRCHAEPRALAQHRMDGADMARRLTLVQDQAQIQLYEDKAGQFTRWGHWMPDTWLYTDLDDALHFLAHAEYPLVSKANEGASSVNVRILRSRQDAEAHARQAFGEGIKVNCCADGAMTVQRGYLLLQRFIPHLITYRVNIIGRQQAIFERSCYPDKPVAQTGNVRPVMALTPLHDSLLEYASEFFTEAQTKWCAVDILRDGNQWRLLETSLAWPWPSPGECMNAPFYPNGSKWSGMFGVLMDEIEAGVWDG